MAILKPKTEHAARKALRVHLDAALFSELEQVRADAQARGLVFDVADVCTRALTQAVHTARRELKAHSEQGHAPASGQ